jgi:hypothetical protein
VCLHWDFIFLNLHLLVLIDEMDQRGRIMNLIQKKRVKRLMIFNRNPHGIWGFSMKESSAA